MGQSHQPIAIVGTGAVAQTLGRLLAAAGRSVVALAGRTRSKAEAAAHFIGGSGVPVQVVAIAELPRIATHVLIAVSDRGIEPVAETLASAGMQSGAALHTCGAKGPEALAALKVAGVACGVLHPLQTIVSREQGVISLAAVTFGLSGDPEALEWAEQIVTSLHGHSLHIDPDRLSYYHAGAVMASNAVVAVLDAAIVLLVKAGIDRDDALGAIEPLTRTSVNNVFVSGPNAALTGPVVRGDAGSVARHMRALQDVDPAVAKLYEAVAGHLLQLARQRGLPEPSVRELQSVLDKKVRLKPDTTYEG